MNKGNCLCGRVTWEVSAEPYRAFNCHCKMCQKAHGTAYGTYWFFGEGEVRITAGADRITFYRSSEFLTRASCDDCGSVVPYSGDNGDHWVTPGGCHDVGRGSDCDIFVVDNSPWHDLTGHLPRHVAYPVETGLPSVPDKDVGPRQDGVVRGSCLCGEITYHVTTPFKIAHYCHCSRCRHARAAPFASNAITSLDGVEFLTGVGELRRYELPEARYFAQVFCRICSSAMPNRDPGRGITIVPMGGLDDDPCIKPCDHIFTGSMSGWHEITDALPQFEEYPD